MMGAATLALHNRIFLESLGRYWPGSRERIQGRLESGGERRRSGAGQMRRFECARLLRATNARGVLADSRRRVAAGCDDDRCLRVVVGGA